MKLNNKVYDRRRLLQMITLASLAAPAAALGACAAALRIRPGSAKVAAIEAARNPAVAVVLVTRDRDKAHRTGT